MKCKYKTEKGLMSVKTKLNILERFNKGELLKKKISVQLEEKREMYKMEKSNNLYSECFPIVSGYYCILKKLELELIVDLFWVWAV